ncbi:universal stress protein (plasmid) [Azospirillum sp. B510]|uniref:universal stress protein n=1 Tax=Azospirillum sp. (strain B510) TaxID=137722 RepID=UPI0001C4B8BA|nr:universal stress protein [Azospirillum sp. B510]BAI74643.1 universal stress protein [Azospirillum sp. B510]
MMLRDILVHVDHTAEANVRVGVAARLATAHGARLTGIYVRPALTLPRAAQNFAGPGLQAELERASDELAKKARIAFHKHGGTGDGDLRWLEDTGNPAERIAEQARYYDLAVVGNTETDNTNGRAGDRAILSSGVPVMVVPPRLTRPAVGNRIIVAWNGSREAVRAVHSALPLLRNAGATEIFMVMAQSQAATSPPAGSQLLDFLARHGVTASITVLPFDETHGVSGQVLARLDAFDADLVVMGGFGRSWLREAMIGSTTGILLTRAPVPLFITH